MTSIIITRSISTSGAQYYSPNCSYNHTTKTLDSIFGFTLWLNRGHCIRTLANQGGCQSNLEPVLEGLIFIDAQKYGTSASTLGLLPTIGALFGTPTSEIWTLLTVLPVRSSLAILLYLVTRSCQPASRITDRPFRNKFMYRHLFHRGKGAEFRDR